MRRDFWTVYGPALLGVVCLGLLVRDLKTGTIRHRYSSYSREDEPLLYWSLILFYAALSVAALGFSAASWRAEAGG